MALSFAIAGMPGRALAQSRTSSIPTNVKTAAAAGPAMTAAIDAFVGPQVKALSNDGNADAQQRARDALVKEAGAAGATPSPAYLTAYATAVNRAMVPLARHKSVRVRLNAAIATFRIADRVKNAALAEAATKFTQDASYGVALWGTRAGQPVLPAVAAAGKPHPLTGAIVEAVKRNPDSGELADEAYKGLTLDLNLRLLNDAAVNVVLKDMLRLVEFRAGQYVTRTPPRPDLEQQAANFLSHSRIWELKGLAPQRPAIMQQMSNLIGVVAQHAAAREAEARPTFMPLIQGLGAALAEVGRRADVKDGALVAAGTGLTELRPTSFPDEFTTRATAAYDAIKKRFPETKEPPKVEEAATQELTEQQIQEEQDAAEPPAGGTPAAKPAGKPAAKPASPAVNSGGARQRSATPTAQPAGGP